MSTPAFARTPWSEVIPAHMQQRAQWVRWADVGTQKKVPFVIGNGAKAKSNDPTTWRSFEEAAAHHEKDPRVGYVFTPADGLVFIDVDKCLDDAGELKPWAVPLVRPFIDRTYVEVSPSGRGLHVFARGAVDVGGGKKVPIGDGAVEVYTHARYSTVTGEIYRGSDLLDEAQDAIDALMRSIAPPPAPKHTPAFPPDRPDVLSALRARGLHKRELGAGKHSISCPWVEEHTDEIDGGTVFYEPSHENDGAGGFKCQHAHCGSRHVGDLFRFLGLGGERAKPRGQPDSTTTTEPTRLLSVADIFATLPPVNWLCQALDVAPGAPLLIAGYGYSGKTVAAQDLALAVATGTMVWGRFPVRAGRVLHLDYEQGTYLTRMRYQRLARARGIDPREIEGRLTLAPMPEWYLDGDTRDELPRLCEGVDLVIVDSLRAACPSIDENSSEARIPLDRLSRISEATGVTPVVIHHARKPTEKAQGGARMAVRGSGAFYDACGSVLVFAAEKGEPVQVAHEKARITGRTHGDLLLHIEDVDVDGDPTAGLRVSATDALTKTKEKPGAQYAGVRARVLEVVRAAGTFPGGTGALRSRLGGRQEDVSAAVADLLAAGAIQRGGSYRDPTFVAVGKGLDHE